MSVPVKTAARSYWDEFPQAAANFGAPLRPPLEAVRFMENTAMEWARSHPGEGLRALLLGVTAEIACMRWPEAATLLAVDCSYPMVQSVWSGNVPGKRAAVCANWLALPARPASRDIAIGDGSFNCLDFPDGLRAAARSVESVVQKDGLFVLRCFVQAEPRESLDALFDEALRGSIGSFHAFKLRLLMALQESAHKGVAVKDAYWAWTDRKIDLERLPSSPGWAKPAVETIGLYRDAETVYSFPTLDELRMELAEFFEEISVTVHSYELAERCPILVLRPRP